MEVQEKIIDPENDGKIRQEVIDEGISAVERYANSPSHLGKSGMKLTTFELLAKDLHAGKNPPKDPPPPPPAPKPPTSYRTGPLLAHDVDW